MPSPHLPSYLVGKIFKYDAETNETSDPFEIYSDEEVFVGRDKKKCQYAVEDPFISNRHLRIYTIIFDQENPLEVAPMVYAQDISRNGTTWSGYPMRTGTGSYLLRDGDTLKLSANFYLLFRADGYSDYPEFDPMQQLEIDVLQDQYVITQCKLGSGAYGQVHMAFKKKTGQQFACKIIDLAKVKNRAAEEIEQSSYFEEATPSAVAVREKKQNIEKQVQAKVDQYNREALILERLCHPNIIGMEKVIKSENTIYLFQELVTAGDMFSFIQYKGGKLGDIESAVIVRQILLALDYLHDRDIVHRDLKPDNILMTSLADGGRVVLTDFGCARLARPAMERMSTMVGTFEYSAPEVLRSNEKGYTKAVDLWSLGCLTVALLTGESPFRHLPAGCTENDARQCDLECLDRELEWNNTGDRAKRFIGQLLVLDETKRMNVKEALGHEWFTNPAHKREFENVYKRAIRDWQPRVHKGPLIEDLGSFIERGGADGSQPSQIPGRMASTELTHESSAMHHADAETSRVSSQISAPPGISEKRRSISPTLSDPDLPAYKRVRRETSTSRQGFSHAPKQVEQTMNVAFTPEPASQFCFGRVSNSLANGMQNTAFHSSDVAATAAHENGYRGRESNIHPANLAPNQANFQSPDNPVHERRPEHRPRKERQPRRSIWSGLEDEVYEEVNNVVTGERDHVLYGADRR